MGANVITSTDLAKKLSDVLNRVRYRRETFVVERNNEAVASIAPAAQIPAFTADDFLREFGKRHVPPGFGEGLDKANQVLREVPEPPIWDS